MIIEPIAHSAMFLSAAIYQPVTSYTWSILSTESNSGQLQNIPRPDIEREFFSIDRDSYNLDPIFMGDFRRYVFEVEAMDKESHNFYLK